MLSAIDNYLLDLADRAILWLWNEWSIRHLTVMRVLFGLETALYIWLEPKALPIAISFVGVLIHCAWEYCYKLNKSYTLAVRSRGTFFRPAFALLNAVGCVHDLLRHKPLGIAWQFFILAWIYSGAAHTPPNPPRRKAPAPSLASSAAQ